MSMFAKPHIRDEEKYGYINSFADQWKSKWSLEWDSATEAKKAAILEDAAQFISRGITRQYFGEQTLRVGNPLEVKFAELKKNTRGLSIQSTIMLNTKNGIPSKEDALKIIAHEATHHAQYIIKKNLFPLNMTQELWLIQGCLGSDMPKESFGIQFDQKPYIRSRSLFTQDVKLRHALYTLQFVERQARQESLKIANAIGVKSDEEIKFFNEALDVFRDRYNCPELTDEQIFATIDSAQYHLLSEGYPLDSLTASVLYDMAVMMKDQEMTMVWANNGYNTIKELSGPENKLAALISKGYDQVLALDEPEIEESYFDRG